jgi:hypothetical protein
VFARQSFHVELFIEARPRVCAAAPSETCMAIRQTPADDRAGGIIVRIESNS